MCTSVTESSSDAARGVDRRGLLGGYDSLDWGGSHENSMRTGPASASPATCVGRILPSTQLLAWPRSRQSVSHIIVI
jgi:hypothetical protein